ncbi:unnamed protein product [Strongylus vulgaris]|uniref:G-protein coupled receptors family 1 profile domain-containing protein n=1 Tax=Strongylus vulgaris TaxID=40348 RepID=A0A3P7M4C1_STRVU|nr:unnamed protein product [Strongylus vulgaris]
MSNNVVNPLLYAWLNPTFRKLVVTTIFGSVGKRGSLRMINRPWVYRSLPPRSQTEKLNDLQTPITAETPAAETDTKLIEYDDSDTFV